MFPAIWNVLRTVLRLGLLALFTLTVIGMMVMAWLGLSSAFRPEVAAVLLAFSVLIRFNVFALAGSYFFATSVLHLPELRALLFLLPALGLLFPAPLIDILKGLWEARAD